MKTIFADSLELPVQSQPRHSGWLAGLKNWLLVTCLLGGLGAYGFLLVASVIWLTSH